MIKVFETQDLDKFTANKFSQEVDLSFIDNEGWIKFSVIRNGTTKAIISFYEESKDNWVVFLMVGVGFDVRDVRRLARLLDLFKKDFLPKRIFSISQIDDSLDKWHRFWGLEIESVFTAFDKKYNKWSWRCVTP